MEGDQNPSCDQCKKSSVKSSCSDKDRLDKSEVKLRVSEKATLSQSSLREYNHILSSILDHCRPASQLIYQLQKYGISYLSNSLTKKIDQHQQITVQSLKKTKHSQVVSMTVSLGPFSQNITIYNTLSPSIFSKDLLISSGKSTSIYLFTKNHKFYIAKSISFEGKSKQNNVLKRKEFLAVVKEYFITKIMSVLKIGPKICSQFGFDIFLSDDDVSFFLEHCESSTNRNFMQEDGLELKRSLKQMHSLSILHRDIKPENIMYSPSYGKYVLIDFGISKYTNERPGEKMFTSFAGTYSYCSEEVKKLFSNHECSYVDLYFNDAYGLELSIQQMIHAKKIILSFGQSQGEFQQENMQLNDFLTEVRIKYWLYMSKTDKIYEQEQMLHLPQKIGNSILNFLYEIPLNDQIRKIYQLFLDQYSKNQKQFQELRQIFQSKIYFESCKGKREFTSIEQVKKIKQIDQFYEEIKQQKSNESKNKRKSIKKLEQFLFSPLKIRQSDEEEYQNYLIEYLNFKRIESPITIKCKIQVSKIYLIGRQLKTQQQISQLSSEHIVELVFYHVILNIAKRWKMDIFFLYLIALQNYFIFADNVDMKIWADIRKIISHIDNEQSSSLLEKTEFLLYIFLSFPFFRYATAKFEDQSQINSIEKLIKQKVTLYGQKSIQTQSTDMKTCEVYVSCLNYFSHEYSTLYKCDPIKLFNQINEIKPKRPYSSRLINYLQYKLLIRIKKAEKIFFQQQQKQEIIIEEMQSQKQINSIIICIISCYDHQRKTKIIKKFLEIFDSAIQLNQVCIKYFPYIRIYSIIAEQKDKINNTRSANIQKICLQLMPLIQINPSNFIAFSLQIQKIIYLYSNLQKIKIIRPKILQKMKQTVLERIPEMIKLYQILKPSVLIKNSQNLFYLQLLLYDIQAKYLEERSLLMESFRSNNNAQTSTLFIYPRIESFRKIIGLNRSNFTKEDHIFLFSFDLIQLKIEKGEKANRQILDYFIAKKQLISQVFTIENTKQRTYIRAAFSFFLNFLSNQKQLEIIREALKLIYPIVEKKIIISNEGTGFNHSLTKCFARLGKFEEIIYEIIDCCRFYNDHISKTNIIDLAKLCSNTIKIAIDFNKEKQFFVQLKKVIRTVDLKKIPVFAIFLLFCIRPFNRAAIIKLIARSLNNIMYNGKYFILSRYYKELLKLSTFAKKKKLLMRKDAIYPSSDMLTMEDMKKRLNCITGLTVFAGANKEMLSNKFLKLGKCCEVYSVAKVPHPFNDIADFSILNRSQYRNEMQEWKSEDLRLSIAL